MAGLRKYHIAARISRVLSDAGCWVRDATFVGAAGDLPWRCTVSFPDGASRQYSLYFWTISHGGRTRAHNEYRIQAKLKQSRSLDSMGGTTLLMGYYSAGHDRIGRDEGNLPFADMEVFVAWDPLQHLRVGASSSCQVAFEVLERAFLNGFACAERRNSGGDRELVVGVRSELLCQYLRAAAGGHNLLDLTRITEISRHVEGDT